MAARLVVVDASPIIGLAAAEAFDILRGLFGSVVVVEAVRQEVSAGPGRPGATELDKAVAEGWVLVRPDPAGSPDFPDLGPGGAATIALAIGQEGPCLVVLDDAVARARAQAEGLTVVGVAGLLLAAKRMGLIGRLREPFERLEQHGFRIAPEVVRSILQEGGES
jgi:predicted nucleic acid-binding protein